MPWRVLFEEGNSGSNLSGADFRWIKAHSPSGLRLILDEQNAREDGNLGDLRPFETHAILVSDAIWRKDRLRDLFSKPLEMTARRHRTCCGEHSESNCFADRSVNDGDHGRCDGDDRKADRNNKRCEKKRATLMDDHDGRAAEPIAATIFSAASAGDIAAASIRISAFSGGS